MRRVKQLTVIILWILSLAISVQGQEIVLEEDVNKDTVEGTYGRNLTNFSAAYAGYGMVIGDFTGTNPLQSLKKGRSIYLDFGMYYKRKLNNLYSVTGEFGYRLNVFSYSISDPLMSPVPLVTYKYSRLVISNAHAGIFNRFNYGKRGNRIGNYIAIGATMDYGYLNKVKEKYESADSSSSRTEKVVRSQNDFINRLAYHGEVQLGFDKIVLTGAYRLNDLIKKNEGYQLPPLVIGFRFDLGA